ncbi:hypothetical protein R3X27_21475 [Tropicimonas sp. TH_r6]|uniref:hypothetical protein n=1 Tax=Tropicimonas sp. TH_r6 TaxID=3082085 RepID=UPI002955331D|nr:hypothetical protein [Tropicimonas sp. TH_r6]MDV7145262.1 hypothetical protein [Tropicimonas sp. TH_r6]
MTGSETAEGSWSARLPLVSMASVLLGFAALQLAAFLNAGVFEYPLDDVYIHLAVAEQIAAGGYGVNPGENASAASSLLYPLLLAMAPGSEVQRVLPLLWNLLALAASGWIWGRILVQAGYESWPRWVGLLLAGAVPLLLNMAGIAFTGMEQSLHVAASLAVILGMLVLLDEDRVTPLLLLGIVLGPAFRFEAMGVSLLGAALLVLRGRYALGLLFGLLALAVAGLFMGLLVALGMDPLPYSVQAKMGTIGDLGLRDRILVNFIVNFKFTAAWALLAALVIAPLMFLLVPGMVRSPRRLLLYAVMLALMAHLLVGKVGWMNRYESYILLSAMAGLLALAAQGGRGALLGALLPAAIVASSYVPDHVLRYPFATRTIDRQQAQMARFAKQVHAGPVAVNDLGWVSWGNPNYVLDLWGLGSKDAQDYRMNGGLEDWTDKLAGVHSVDLAMIYDDWLADHIGADWVRLGQLELTGSHYFAARPEVAFYATGPEAVPALRDELALWAEDLPEGASFTFSPEGPTE